MKPQKLFYLLSTAKTKQEFIRILRKNRIPLSIDINKKTYNSTSITLKSFLNLYK